MTYIYPIQKKFNFLFIHSISNNCQSLKSRTVKFSGGEETRKKNKKKEKTKTDVAAD